MKLLIKLLNKLNGLHYPQEYLCLANESFSNPLRAYQVQNKTVLKDITALHLFVGYRPLIFALSPLQEPNLDKWTTIDILFTHKILHQNETFAQKDAMAMLSLKRIHQQAAGEDMVWYFEGINGWHRFLSTFHQWIIGLNNRLANQRAGNVFLADNLYTQVQIAYSVPRNISLITVAQNDLYNLFPTDLHGEIDGGHYIISLRHEGKACQQVLQEAKILITQVESQFYKTAYALGKNHMRDCRKKKDFPFSDSASPRLQLPLPESAVFFHELELQQSFVHGIHRLMVFKVLSRQQVRPNASNLLHIHNTYATWRHRHHLPGNYLAGLSTLVQ
jgi:hypothetical protein